MKTEAAVSRWLPVVRPIHQRLSVRLDLIRWLAAFLVCISHVRSLCIVDYGAESGWATRAFYFIHGFGHSAVMVFFVLSGYLIGGEVLKALRNGTFDPRSYFTKRAARLYTPYLPALVLLAGIDWLGFRHFNVEGLYTNGKELVMVFYDISERLTFETGAGNFLFLQTLKVPTLGSNTPLWSLTCEAWYYLLFPLAAIVCFSPLTRVTRLVCALMLLFAGWFVGGEILIYFGVWLSGACIHFLNRSVFRTVWPSVAIILTAATCLRLHSTGTVSVWVWNFVIAAGTALLINTLSHTPGNVPAGARAHRALSGFSYSLYLCHWPLALFLMAVLYQKTGHGIQMPLSAFSLSIYTGLVLCIYGFSWGFAWLTERNTRFVRTWLDRVFDATRP